MRQKTGTLAHFGIHQDGMMGPLERMHASKDGIPGAHIYKSRAAIFNNKGLPVCGTCMWYNKLVSIAVEYGNKHLMAGQWAPLLHLRQPTCQEAVRNITRSMSSYQAPRGSIYHQGCHDGILMPRRAYIHANVLLGRIRQYM